MEQINYSVPSVRECLDAEKVLLYLLDINREDQEYKNNACYCIDKILEYMMNK